MFRKQVDAGNLGPLPDNPWQFIVTPLAIGTAALNTIVGWRVRVLKEGDTQPPTLVPRRVEIPLMLNDAPTPVKLYATVLEKNPEIDEVEFIELTRNAFTEEVEAARCERRGRKKQPVAAASSDEDLWEDDFSP